MVPPYIEPGTLLHTGVPVNLGRQGIAKKMRDAYIGLTTKIRSG